jgi:hypothetical protein
MKVYIVVEVSGSYDAQSWRNIAVFDNKEKAQELISKETKTIERMQKAQLMVYEHMKNIWKEAPVFIEMSEYIELGGFKSSYFKLHDPQKIERLEALKKKYQEHLENIKQYRTICNNKRKQFISALDFIAEEERQDMEYEQDTSFHIDELDLQ